MRGVARFFWDIISCFTFLFKYCLPESEQKDIELSYVHYLMRFKNMIILLLTNVKIGWKMIDLRPFKVRLHHIYSIYYSRNHW